MAKFGGNVAAAETWIKDSLNIAQDYFMDDASFGSKLTLYQIGEIVYEDAEYKIEDTLSNTLRDTTLLKMENAHMIIYYIGQPKGNRFGQAGCIGCICRPDRKVSNQIESKFDWTPFRQVIKHCLVAKTNYNNPSFSNSENLQISKLRQGRVRSLK